MRRFPNIIPISISLYTPHWFTGFKYPLLSPTPDILHDYKSKLIDVDTYINRYLNQVLIGLDSIQVLSNISRIGNGNDIALCCYEKSGEFCHRHLVANWLNNEIMYWNLPHHPITELVYGI